MRRLLLPVVSPMLRRALGPGEDVALLPVSSLGSGLLSRDVLVDMGC